MVKIKFLGPINKEDMDLDITNLSQLSEILKKDAEVSTWLTNCAVAVNDTLVTSKDIPLKNGDKTADKINESLKNLIIKSLD